MSTSETKDKRVNLLVPKYSIDPIARTINSPVIGIYLAVLPLTFIS